MTEDNLQQSGMITGTHINYYFVCLRKLWLFSRGLVMEQNSDTVLIGRLIDESSYERKEKHIDIDGTIAIDWIDTNTGVLHEVKKSDSMEDAHTWQVLYYLWYLKQKGVKIASVEGQCKRFPSPAVNLTGRKPLTEDEGGLQPGLRGEIDYPKLKEKVEVVLTPEREKELEGLIEKIKTIMHKENPSERKNKKFCKTCSYFDFCWAGT